MTVMKKCRTREAGSFQRILVSGLIPAAVFLSIAPGAGAAEFQKGPYLIYESLNTAMKILWQTNTDAEISRIEWGLDTSYSSGFETVPPSGADHQYFFTISGLTPDTHYFYQIEVDGVFRRGDFRTAPEADASKITIWAYGDTRTNPAVQDQVLGAMLTKISGDSGNNRTILLHSGDLVSNGEDETSWTDEFFPPDQPHIQKARETLALMACRGNHEGNGDLFRKYFPYPYADDTSFNYSFDYGPIHIAVVDDQSDISPGSNQYVWVENDLASSDACWKFVLIHETAYSAGGHPNNSTNQTLTSDLLEPAGVDLVINGHNHYYSRALKNGLNHITAGGGGAPLYDPDPGYPYIVVAIKSYNYMRIDINGSSLRFTAFDENNNELDSFMLTKNCSAIFADGFERGDSGDWY